MNVPKIRFKPDVGGAYPEWVSKPLKEVCKKIKDGTHFSPKSKSGPRKYITSKNIRNSGLDLSNCSYISEDEHREIYRRCSAALGDVLLTKDGAGTGNCCLNTLAEEFSLLSSVAVLSGEAGILSNEFLLQILQSKSGQNTISNVIAGQAITRITLDKINKFTFMLPHYEEQKKIALFLSLIDKKISLLTEECHSLSEYKKGVMQKIFNQEFRFQDKGGRDYPKWELKKIGDALTIGSGRDYKHLSPGNIPVYGTGGFMLSVNDFLYDGVSACIGRKGTIDKPVLLSGKFWTVDTLFYTHKFINCSPEFIYTCFQMINWKSYCEASGVPSLSKSTIEAIEISLPCIAEQKQITDFFAALDNKITNIKSKLALSKQYKQGLLQQMFI